MDGYVPRWRSALAAAVMIVALTAAEAVAAPSVVGLGTASGTLTVNGEAMPLRHAYAMAQPSALDASQKVIAVALTEKPLRQGALAGIAELDDALLDVRGYAYFEISEEAKPVREVVKHPIIPKQMLQTPDGALARFTPAVFGTGKDRIEGRFATAGTETLLQNSYELRVDFAAAVATATTPEPLPDAATGKALPRDGGDPGRAYLALHAAVLRRDLPEIAKLNASLPDPLPPEGKFKGALEAMAAMEPGEPKIARGYVRGDRAVLYVTGVQEKKERYGTVQLVRTKGIWRVSRQVWSDTPPK